jgi:DEAD/DEAH box helicase domain-containing protein
LLILLDHIRCAAFELPFRDGDTFGKEDLNEMLAYLQEHGVVHHEAGRWHWMDDSYPANSVSLRSVAEGNFVVIDTTGGAQTVIAEVDYSSAPETIYEGAIYMVQSAPYQVEKLDWEGRKAFVTRTRADYYTDAIDYTRLKILDEEELESMGNQWQNQWGQTRLIESIINGVKSDQSSLTPLIPLIIDSTIDSANSSTVSQGEVHLVRRIAGYKKIRYYTHENVGYGNIDLPDQEMHTTAVWWQVNPDALFAPAGPGDSPDPSNAGFASRQQALDGFLGAGYALHIVAAMRMLSEPRDIGRAVGDGNAEWFAAVGANGRGQMRNSDGEAIDPGQLQRFTPTLFLYDNYPGGIGISAPLFENRRAIVADAQALVSTCECAHGCPSCIGPILASDEVRGYSPKQVALRVLSLLGACRT